jgi:putative FmdB family regulatory protein
MPTYDYHCSNCQHTLEAFQKITDEPLLTCPTCGNQTLKRGPGGGIGLSFKGTGYYITDYARKEERTPSAEPTKSSECCPCGQKKDACSG